MDDPYHGRVPRRRGVLAAAALLVAVALPAHADEPIDQAALARSRAAFERGRQITDTCADTIADSAAFAKCVMNGTYRPNGVQIREVNAFVTIGSAYQATILDNAPVTVLTWAVSEIDKGVAGKGITWKLFCSLFKINYSDFMETMSAARARIIAAE